MSHVSNRQKLFMFGEDVEKYTLLLRLSIVRTTWEKSEQIASKLKMHTPITQ